MKVSEGLVAMPRATCAPPPLHDAFHLLPVARETRFGLPATHPPLRARIERLERLERALQHELTSRGAETRSRDPLRARLPELTLQDEYRLGQRLKRLKKGDAQGRERLERDVEQRERARSSGAAPRFRRSAIPSQLPVSGAARGPARGDPRQPGRDRRRRDRLGQDDAAAEDLPRARAAACAGRSRTRSRGGWPRARSPSGSPTS